MNTNMGIYKIINKVDGKFYIGSSKELKRRKRVHFKNLKDNKHVNTHLQHAFNKYGEQNFKFEVIEYTDDPSTLLDLEQKWIDETNCYDKNVGYNIMKTAGGGALFGGDNGAARKILQIDTKTLAPIKVWGCILDAKEVEGVSVGYLQKICKQIEVENIWKKYRGYYWCYEEDFNKINHRIEYKNPIKKEVVQISIITGNVINKYKTITDASEKTGVHHGCISQTCLGKRKSAGGYVWKYYDEYVSLKGESKKTISLEQIKGKGKYNPHAKKVAQLNLKGDYINVFNTATEAHKETGTNLTSISSCCTGNRKTAGGYKWMYYEDYQALTKQ